MFISCNSPANGLIMTKLVIPILISSYIYEGPDSVSYKFNWLCFLRFSRHYYFVKNGIGSCLCAVASRQWSWSTDCSCWESDQVLPDIKSRSFNSAYSSLREGVSLVLVLKFSILNYIYRLKYFARSLQELSTDSLQHVRSALASVIMGMAPVLGKV